MKEISNYFGLECTNFKTNWLDDRVLLNSGRNALRYIIRANKINKIWVPAYTCPFVWDSLKSENCEIAFYHIDEDFMPNLSFPKNDFILYNNYFGICDNQIEDIKKIYKNLIIDNTQAIYSKQKGFASFYSLRKFFGVADGGFAWCDKKVDGKFETADSYQLYSHLLKCYDKGFESSYINFIKNELSLDNAEIKNMSKLTKALLSNIDYNKARKIRLNNFNFLHKHLKNDNKLMFNLNENDIPMVYPFLIENENLLNKLLKNKIRLILCWPDIEKNLSNWELYLKKYLLPLPVSQNYNKDDMVRILEILKD